MINFVFTLFAISHVSEPGTHHKYVIVGAGPGGLQLGYFFEKDSMDYLILERGESVGTFFQTYPRHRELISINKRFVGRDHPDFALRHDWNSLLNEKFLFTNYSSDFFPNADRYVDYLQDFAEGLNVKLNVEITSISRNNDNHFQLRDSMGSTYTCEVLIIATGLSKPNIPPIPGIELAVGYEEMNVDDRAYTNHSVLILGAGNSAYEIANNITGSAADMTLLSRGHQRFAWQTHYVGDLRAVNNNYLDTYQLKSLSGLIHFDFIKQGYGLARDETTGKIKLARTDGEPVRQAISRYQFDTVIRATGFKFDVSIFDEEVTPSVGFKHPNVTSFYESINVPGMYFAGTAMHGRDFRKSSGGFVHGFRYLTRTLFNILRARYHNVKWQMSSSFPHSSETIASTIQERIQTSSGPYQMFAILGDLLVVSKENFTIYHDIPLEWKLDELASVLPAEVLQSADHFYTWHFDYGTEFKSGEANVFRSTNCGQLECAMESNFLHPIINYISRDGTLRRTVHIVEDPRTEFNLDHEHRWALHEFVKTMETDPTSKNEPWYGNRAVEMKAAERRHERGQKHKQPHENTMHGTKEEEICVAMEDRSNSQSHTTFNSPPEILPIPKQPVPPTEIKPNPPPQSLMNRLKDRASN